MEKIPYVPSETKRFEISKDPVSRDRLNFVVELHSYLLEMATFDIGCSLVGSLSKGKKLNPKEASRADIDIIFYYDADGVINNFEDGSIPDTMKSDYYFSAGRLDLFMKMGNPEIVLPEIDFSKWKDNDDIKVKVARRFIAYNARKFMENESDRFGNPKIDNFTSNIVPLAISGKYSLLDYVQHEDPEEAQSRFRHLENKIPLAWAFGLDIGGHMKKYRQAFIDQLSELPTAEAERLWGVTNNAVRYWERKGEVPANLDDQFPSTFEKAKAYYKVRG